MSALAPGIAGRKTSKLSSLVECLETGRETEVIIARDGTPVARHLLAGPRAHRPQEETPAI